jgi:hypothetical protein
MSEIKLLAQMVNKLNTKVNNLEIVNTKRLVIKNLYDLLCKASYYYDNNKQHINDEIVAKFFYDLSSVGIRLLEMNRIDEVVYDNFLKNKNNSKLAYTKDHPRSDEVIYIDDTKPFLGIPFQEKKDG